MYYDEIEEFKRKIKTWLLINMCEDTTTLM